jgi:hypothetical protein
VRELASRLEAAERFDEIEIEAAAEDAIETALAAVMGRTFQ